MSGDGGEGEVVETADKEDDSDQTIGQQDEKIGQEIGQKYVKNIGSTR